ncbi:MAG: DNA polymerase I [Lachnospiraceae bacterium]|nr:DNA polymerase I [Lachnospiraceae bacterium]
MNKKIVIIDGHSILNRAFYGVPDLTNSEGLHTNAIFGFLNIMFKILDEEKPAHLVVTFDVKAPTFRHRMFAEYKGTRRPMPQELVEQVPIIKDVLAAMGIYMIEQAGLEADDLMGTISRICAADGMEVSILSGDKDTLQLATDKIKIRVPKTKQGRTEVTDYYAHDVIEAYGVTPTEFIDIKALMGDASDNIPGVPGIGEKTAGKIIQTYKSIEIAYAHVEELKPPRASKNLKEFWEQAKLSKALATIDQHAEIAFDLEASLYENPYTEEAYAFFQELEFKHFLKRFQVTAKENDLEAHFTEVVSIEAFLEKIEHAQKAKRVGVAFAWGYISLAFDSDKIYYFATDAATDIQTEKKEMKEGQQLELNFDTPVAVEIEEAEANENKYQVIYKALEKLANKVEIFSMFDLKEHLDVFPAFQTEVDVGAVDALRRYFDGIIAAYLLNPLKNDYRFYDVAKEYLHLFIAETIDGYKKACYEAFTAFAIVPILQDKLADSGMLKLFQDMEMPLLFTLYNMERRGICVAAQELKDYSEMLGKQIVLLEQEIYQGAGETFNINSPKQLGAILFDKLHMPYGKKTKTGYSTAADVLEKLAPEYPLVSQILEYRQLSKLKSTYADGLANYIQADGRIHGKFNQTIAATGRLSSTEPNLQNIPIRMELGRLIRKVFIPEAGYLFLDADYSQIELRVLAHFSGDTQLIQAYKEAKDIHRMTASQVFHVPFEEVTSLQRRNAKAVNFGIVYGMSSHGLSQDLGISRKEAADYITRYFATYPQIKVFLDDMVTQAKEKGYVKTLFGRRRPVPELNSASFMQRSFGERVAMNAPIQGTAADIMKIAMIAVDKELIEKKLKSRLILQVHDELLIEADKKEIDQVREILQRQMESAADMLVPLLTDIHVGINWFEAK